MCLISVETKSCRLAYGLLSLHLQNLVTMFLVWAQGQGWREFPENIAHSPLSPYSAGQIRNANSKCLQRFEKIYLFFQLIRVKISKTKQKRAIHLWVAVPIEYAGWWMIFLNVIIHRMCLLKSHFSISVAVNYFIKNGTEDVLLCGNSSDAG